MLRLQTRYEDIEYRMARHTAKGYLVFLCYLLTESELTKRDNVCSADCKRQACQAGLLLISVDNTNLIAPLISSCNKNTGAWMVKCRSADPQFHPQSSLCRAGLTIWWALRTPQRRGPTGKLDAEEGEMGGMSPPQPTRGLGSVI